MSNARPSAASSRLSAIFSAAVLAFAVVAPFSTAQQPARRTARPAAAAQAQSFDQLSRSAANALDADQLDAAIKLFRKALAIRPDWAEGWWSLGTALYDQERYAEAETAFQKVVTLEPKHGTAHAFLGLCQFQIGEDKAALHNIEASRELGTDVDPQLRDVIFYHEGILLLRANRFVAAEKPFVSLCLSGAHSREVIHGFGMAALRLREGELPAGTDSPNVIDLVGRGACYAAQKDYDSARRAFDFAATSYPQVAFVHYAFGRVLFDARDIPGAVEQFKQEIDLGHNKLLPMLQIAACEYKVDSADGLTFAEQAVALAPRVPFARLLRGLLLVDSGEDAKAIPDLELARKAFPRDAKVYWALAAAYAHVGRTQDAAKTRGEVARIFRGKPSQQSDNPESPDALNTPIEMNDSADEPAAGAAPQADPKQ
ncbi:MAG TPA: tetratricopeptide repeat protein [Terracidiphilus sp.]